MTPDGWILVGIIAACAIAALALLIVEKSPRK